MEDRTDLLPDRHSDSSTQTLIANELTETIHAFENIVNRLKCEVLKPQDIDYVMCI
jgi:hypothetical protein